MHPSSLRATIVGIVLLALVCVAGCSEKTVVVTGKLVFPATPKVQDTDSIGITFLPVEPDKKTPAAIYSPSDKSFTAKDVPPGKYKITVSVTPYMGQKDSDKRAPLFETFNKTFERGSSKLIYEVTGDPPQQSITVDLDKGTVTKG